MDLIFPEENELKRRIDLNYTRLAEGDYYRIEHVFSPASYDWYGDKEGRALLAFVCHYRINGREIPCMKALLKEMDERLNEDGYFGPIYATEIHEQQLSGHSWLLRGLCAYYEAFRDEGCLAKIRRIVEHLYLPKRGRFATYPVDRQGENGGGVSGSVEGQMGDWMLSSDVGCAFMSIDGLSHAYRVWKDGRIKSLLDEMISVYLPMDKVKLRAQTHCTLTAARGMVRMYEETGEEAYLCGAKEILDLYANGGGMTATYQNLNWWGRPDSWTEPCAIVDSMMLAGELYRISGKDEYRALAARIYHNGLATAQRQNGGAGTDSPVIDGVEDHLTSKMYEAYFCCTMRLAEGLWYVYANRAPFGARLDGEVKRVGRTYRNGDILYAEVTGDAKNYVTETVEVDGYTLSPLVKYYKLSRREMENSKQRILF